jgi:hypothetical protein
MAIFAVILAVAMIAAFITTIVDTKQASNRAGPGNLHRTISGISA